MQRTQTVRLPRYKVTWQWLRAATEYRIAGDVKRAALSLYYAGMARRCESGIGAETPVSDVLIYRAPAWRAMRRVIDRVTAERREMLDTDDHTKIYGIASYWLSEWRIEIRRAARRLDVADTWQAEFTKSGRRWCSANEIRGDADGEICGDNVPPDIRRLMVVLDSLDYNGR